MKGLVCLLGFIPLVVQAQVYRCQSEGDTYFSQIPCAENSEVVQMEDQEMSSDTAQGGIKSNNELIIPSEPAKTTADKLMDFVSTLERQKVEQVEPINKKIAKIKAQLDSDSDAPDNPGRQDALNEKLTLLHISRRSITSQYDSMIIEAERRVAALSEQGSSN